MISDQLDTVKNLVKSEHLVMAELTRRIETEEMLRNKFHSTHSAQSIDDIRLYANGKSEIFNSLFVPNVQPNQVLTEGEVNVARINTFDRALGEMPRVKNGALLSRYQLTPASTFNDINIGDTVTSQLYMSTSQATPVGALEFAGDNDLMNHSYEYDHSFYTIKASVNSNAYSIISLSEQEASRNILYEAVYTRGAPLKVIAKGQWMNNSKNIKINFYYLEEISIEQAIGNPIKNIYTGGKEVISNGSTAKRINRMARICE